MSQPVNPPDQSWADEPRSTVYFDYDDDFPSQHKVNSHRGYEQRFSTITDEGTFGELAAGTPALDGANASARHSSGTFDSPQHRQKSPARNPRQASITMRSYSGLDPDHRQDNFSHGNVVPSSNIGYPYERDTSKFFTPPAEEQDSAGLPAGSADPSGTLVGDSANGNGFAYNDGTKHVNQPYENYESVPVGEQPLSTVSSQSQNQTQSQAQRPTQSNSQTHSLNQNQTLNVNQNQTHDDYDYAQESTDSFAPLGPPQRAYHGSVGGSSLSSSGSEKSHAGVFSNGQPSVRLAPPSDGGSFVSQGSSPANASYSTMDSPSLAARRSASPRQASSVYDQWMPRHSPQPSSGVSRQSGRVTPSGTARMSQYDLSSSFIPQHLGDNAASLMPRIKTIELYRKNAQKSHDPAVEFQFAQYMVQTALLPSTSEENDEDKKVKQRLFKEALAYLRRLAERGHADAQYLLGDIYSSTAVNGKPDNKQSFHYFLMAAKHKHAEAAYRAALCLQEGWGTSRDAARALKFFLMAAARNQPGALYRLGISYFYGHLGLPDNSTNRVEGIKWLTRAAKAANEVFNRAPYELAKIMEVGYKDILLPAPAEAVNLYVQSAELGYVPAAFKLGDAYEQGKLGLPQDAALSIHYYTIGALGNDPKSQLCMCAWYLNGAGTHLQKNPDEAYEWALRAAHNGLPKAMFTVSRFLKDGIGCDRDILESSKWLHRAAEAGFEPAVTAIKNQGGTVASKKECLIM